MLREVIRDWQRRYWFGEMVALGELDKDEEAAKKALRTVVLVRDDILPPIHQGIQAAHAVAALTTKTSTYQELRDIAGSYLILLGADAEQMTRKVELARRQNLQFAMYEDIGLINPDTGNPVWTATAFEPLSYLRVQKWFGNLKRSE